MLTVISQMVLTFKSKLNYSLCSEYLKHQNLISVAWKQKKYLFKHFCMPFYEMTFGVIVNKLQTIVLLYVLATELFLRRASNFKLKLKNNLFFLLGCNESKLFFGFGLSLPRYYTVYFNLNARIKNSLPFITGRGAGVFFARRSKT